MASLAGDWQGENLVLCLFPDGKGGASLASDAASRPCTWLAANGDVVSIAFTDGAVPASLDLKITQHSVDSLVVVRGDTGAEETLSGGPDAPGDAVDEDARDLGDAMAVVGTKKVLHHGGGAPDAMEPSASEDLS